MLTDHLIGIRTCARCKRVFQVYGPEWGYAYDGKLMCSYTCMRAERREDKEVLSTDQKKQIRELYALGKGGAEIAEEMGIKKQAVYDFAHRYINKEKKKEEKTMSEETMDNAERRIQDAVCEAPAEIVKEEPKVWTPLAQYQAEKARPEARPDAGKATGDVKLEALRTLNRIMDMYERVLRM